MTEEKVADGKGDAKVEDGKVDDKVEDGKSDAKVEDGKSDDKVEDGKSDDKLEDGKSDDKVEDGKSVDKVEDGKVDENVEDGKGKEKEEDGQVDAKDDDKIMKVAELLQFFFSDVNLRSDRFMKNELREEPHVLPISTLLRFNSIKRITTDEDHIIRAAESAMNKESLKLNDEKTAVGRVVPFDIRKTPDNIPLTLVVSGLPTEENGKKKRYSVQVPDVKRLFETYGKVTLVRMRYSKRISREKPSHPLGSAFVEFETEEMANKAADDLCCARQCSKIPDPKNEMNDVNEEAKMMKSENEKDDCKGEEVKTGPESEMDEGKAKNLDKEKGKVKGEGKSNTSTSEKKEREDERKGQEDKIADEEQVEKGTGLEKNGKPFNSSDPGTSQTQSGKGLAPIKTLKLKGHSLVIQRMRDWIDEKEKRAKNDGKRGNKRSVEESNDAQDATREEDDARNEDNFELKWEKKCVISISGIPDGCDREAIREAVKDYNVGGPKSLYVDFSRGQKDGAIRFDSFSDKIQELAGKLQDGSIKINESSVSSAAVLEGEAEESYWKKFTEFKRKQFNFKRQNKGNNRFRKKRRY